MRIKVFSLSLSTVTLSTFIWNYYPVVNLIEGRRIETGKHKLRKGNFQLFATGRTVLSYNI